MKTKETKKIALELVSQSESASLYTIVFENDNVSEFAKFMLNFKNFAHLQRDYQIILLALQKILQNGVLERYFRPEGKFNDRVCALPISSGKLRLYCLRLTDKILIIGNGGVKETRSYNEDATLSGYVVDLQRFEAIIRDSIKDGLISIEETVIVGAENKYFDL